MTSQVSTLVEHIRRDVAIVEENLSSNGEPSPSLDLGAPKKVATTGDAETARKQAIQAAEELISILKGPAELLRPDWTDNSSLRIIHRFDLARFVPVDGSATTFTEIARKANLPERDVRRVLRHAMTRNIFAEPRKGQVVHTEPSRLLAEDEGIRGMSYISSYVFVDAMQRIPDALTTWPGSEEGEHSGFSIAHIPGKNMYQTFAEPGELSRKFGAFIGYSGATRSRLDGVEWKGKLVDIGGSHGHAVIGLLREHPEITTAVVQDLPDVVQAGQAKIPKELAGRLQFQPHDFLQTQQEHADIFLLRWILHNWTDKYCVKILRNLIPVLTKDTKIIINDYVLPEPGALPKEQERAIRAADMTMMGTLNATERDVEDWEKLFADADPRFKIENIRIIAPGIMGIITIGWQP